MSTVRRAFGIAHEGHVQLTPEAERRAAIDRLMEQRIRLQRIDAEVSAKTASHAHGYRAPEK